MALLPPVVLVAICALACAGVAPDLSLTAGYRGASIRRIPALGVACVLLGLVAGGCNNECRSLCTAWYDYLRDVCQALDIDDERVRCISDYRDDRVSEEELDLCTGQVRRIEQVSSLPQEDGRRCLCDGDESDCPGADDDDSAAP